MTLEDGGPRFNFGLGNAAVDGNPISAASFAGQKTDATLKSHVLGAVAQLGERCVRNAEVEGPIPFRSTVIL